jgi:hypothetical protein
MGSHVRSTVTPRNLLSVVSVPQLALIAAARFTVPTLLGMPSVLQVCCLELARLRAATRAGGLAWTWQSR